CHVCMRERAVKIVFARIGNHVEVCPHAVHASFGTLACERHPGFHRLHEVPHVAVGFAAHSEWVDETTRPKEGDEPRERKRNDDERQADLQSCKSTAAYD